MDYIFVDTGIFEENNFLDSKVIKQLLKLAEDGEITIVLPKITYNEIIARATLRIRAGIDEFNTAKPYMRAMRNIPSKMHFFDQLKPADVIADFTKTFEAQMKLANYLELGYPTVDVTSIFDSYFTGNFPFGKGDKKHEFPDAFALATIEQWCALNTQKCYVFSTDKDLLNYKSPHLDVVPDYKKFIEAKIAFVTLRNIKAAEAAEAARIQAIVREENLVMEKAVLYLDIRKKDVEKAIEKWVGENLDDDRRYTDVINYLDVLSIDIHRIDVSLNPPELLSIHTNLVEMAAEAEVHFIVEVEIPDESTGWFDSEEREWHYFDNKNIRIERTVAIPLQVSVEVSFDDGYAEAHNFLIAEINEGQDLVISEERGGWHY